MATIGLLSGSTDGAPIPITATSSAGTTVHTSVAGTSNIEMVHLWLNCTHTAAVKVSVEWGQTVAAANLVVTIPADSGLVRITPEGGLPSQNGDVIAIFAGTTAVVNCWGKVVRSTTGEAT